MHFCSVCSNMYYISVGEENNNKLEYYCRKCGNIDANVSADTLVVSKNHLRSSVQEFSHIINKYTKHDPTLPRVHNVLCPNVDCATQKSKDHPEVLYIRYDNANMKYVYLCSVCDVVWKTDDSV